MFILNMFVNNTMPIIDIIMGGLTFSQEKLKNVGNNEEDTLWAWLIIIFAVIWEPLLSLIAGHAPGHSAFGRQNLTGINLFIGVMVSDIIGTVIFAFLLWIVIAFLFKASHVTFNGTIRIIAAANIWRIIGAIGLLLPYPISTIFLAIGFLLMIVVIYIGLLAYSEKRWYIVLLTGIIAFLLNFIVSDIWSILWLSVVG